jgi:hypothetical protein
MRAQSLVKMLSLLLQLLPARHDEFLCGHLVSEQHVTAPERQSVLSLHEGRAYRLRTCIDRGSELKNEAAALNKIEIG